MGRLADHRWSQPLGRAVVGLYTKAYDVRLDECEQQDNFESFDAFFTRTLRPGARPLAGDATTLVSPADGRLDALGEVDDAAVYWVKGRPYRAAELLGSEEEARRYRGGRACVVYLSPRDYHRVHSPVAGHVSEVRSMPGDYYPVNAIGVRHVPNLFAINRRVAIVVDAAPASGIGRVTLVMVAAIVVGRITVSGVDARDVPSGVTRFDPRRPVGRGDELGIFHLGSTVVLFVEPGVHEGAWLSPEGPVRLGAPLLRSKGSRASSAGGAP